MEMAVCDRLCHLQLDMTAVTAYVVWDWSEQPFDVSHA